MFLRVIFWWFRKSQCGEMLIKYQKYQYFNDLRPKCDHLPRYPGHQIQKNIIFTFPIASYIVHCLKVIVCWVLFRRNVDEIPNYLYFDNFDPKMWLFTNLPWSWIVKTHFFFHFYNSFLHILLPKGDFFGGLGGFIGEKCWLNTKIPIFWQF